MANILIGGVNLKTLGMHNGVANARDYGAKANGVYDNTGVVQALIDAWEAINGGIIHFPATDVIDGRYRFTTGVTNDDDEGVVSFTGSRGPHPWAESKPPSTLWLDSTTADAALIKYASIPHTGGMKIQDLALLGNTPYASAAANQSAILFAGRSGNHLINRCAFQYWTGYAIAHDPTVGATYNQNSAIRDCHFWSVAGCFGPTIDYPDAGAYLFNTLYTIDNVGLDHGAYAGTLKPYFWDFRATRNVESLSHFLMEGTGVAGMTACIALASGGKFTFQQIWLEFVSNKPTYLFACYGVDGGKYNSSGEKMLYVGSAGGAPIWFQNSASNETVVHADDWTDYNADVIEEIAVWEDGVENNRSGNIEIDRLHTKGLTVIPHEKYTGRFKATVLGMDMQARLPLPQMGQPRRLMSWNASKGYPFRNWGEGTCHVGSAPNTTWAVEADGNFRCLRATGAGGGNEVPVITWNFGKDVGGFGLAENYAGALLCFAIRYRVTMDPADSGKTVRLLTSSPDGFDDIIVSEAGNTPNNPVYGTSYWIAKIAPNTGTDVYSIRLYWAGPSAPTQPATVRILAFEAWLGIPEYFDLEPSSKPNSLGGQTPIPSFIAADATPSVGGSPVWLTNTGSLTITDLDDFPVGETRYIISKGAITYDMTGGNLVGSPVDIVTVSGDVTQWLYESATAKRLVSVARASGAFIPPPSATGGAGFRLSHGAAPSTPVDGDMWTTAAGGLFVRINGVTKTVTLT